MVYYICGYWLLRTFKNSKNIFFAENGHSITILEKVTENYMNNITSKKEKVIIETIKNDKIVKLPCVPKIGPKLRKGF